MNGLEGRWPAALRLFAAGRWPVIVVCHRRDACAEKYHLYIPKMEWEFVVTPSPKPLGVPLEESVSRSPCF